MSQRTSPPVVIPERPLERFCELYVALIADRPWWQGRTMLRYCAP